MILNDIESIRAYLPANVSTQFADLAPFLETAEEVFLRPEIGDFLLKEIRKKLPQVPEIETLKHKSGRVVAFYAFAEAVPFLAVKFGSNGITNVMSETAEPAKKWQIEALQTQMRQNAYNALDTLLQFLETQEAQGKLKDWNTAAHYVQRQEAFFRTAAQFSQYININGSFLTFRTLYPYLRRAELDFLRPKLGGALFLEVKNNIKHNNIKDKYKLLFADFRGALANYALYLATLENSIQITENGFFVAHRADLRQNEPASRERLKTAADNYYQKAQNDLKAVINVMTENIGQYPLFEKSNYFKTLKAGFDQQKTDKSIFI